MFLYLLYLLSLHVAATGELQGAGSNLLHSHRNRNEKRSELYYPEDDVFESLGELVVHRSLMDAGNGFSQAQKSTPNYATKLQTEYKLCTNACTNPKTGGLQPVDSWPKECFRFCDCSQQTGSRLQIVERPSKGRYTFYFDIKSNSLTSFAADDIKDYRKDYECPDDATPQKNNRLFEFDKQVPDPAAKEHKFFNFTEWTVTGNILPLLFIVYGAMILITIICVLIYAKHQQRVHERENNEAAKANQVEQPLITLKEGKENPAPNA